MTHAHSKCGREAHEEHSGFSLVQFSLLTDWVVGGHERRFSRNYLPVFSAGGSIAVLVWAGMSTIQHFLCRQRCRPPSYVPWKDGFGEAIVACHMPEPCKFPSLYNSQKRFLWTRKEVDLAPHPVVGLVLQVGDAKKSPQALGFERLNSSFFSESASRIHVSQP